MFVVTYGVVPNRDSTELWNFEVDLFIYRDSLGGRPVAGMAMTGAYASPMWKGALL